MGVDVSENEKAGVLKETPAKKYRTICIVGFSESTRDIIPWNNPTIEFWGMNTLWEWMPPEAKWSRWYDLHGLEAYDRIPGKKEKQIEWLKSQAELPVLMDNKYDAFPTSIAYPFKQMEKLYFTENKLAARVQDDGTVISEEPYFTNSVVWMLCHAIYEGVDEIMIYGVDMVKDTEWGYQRPNCEYFIGLARGMGIKVTLPVKAALCRGLWKYGVDDKVPEYHQEALSYFNSREQVLAKERSKWDHERDKAVANFWAHDGALQEIRLHQELFRDRSRGAVLWRGKQEELKSELT